MNVIGKGQSVFEGEIDSCGNPDQTISFTGEDEKPSRGSENRCRSARFYTWV